MMVKVVMSMMRKKRLVDDDDVSDKGIRGGSVEGVMMMVMDGQREG